MSSCRQNGQSISVANVPAAVSCLVVDCRSKRAVGVICFACLLAMLSGMILNCVCMFGWMNSMPQKSPLFANHWQQPSLVWVSSPFADKMGDKVACPNCNHSVLDTFAFKQQFISMVVLSFAIHVWTVYSLYISKHIPSFGRHLSLLVLIDGATKWLSSKPRRDSSVESCN